MADTSLYEKKIGLLIWLTSNRWQSQLRNILKNYRLSLNEYLILETIKILIKRDFSPNQIQLSSFSGINESVVSVTLKSLLKKGLIKRNVDKDNRKKVINISTTGIKLFDEIYPYINDEENILFNKLQNEKSNFSNSLKLILGKKIRIKVKKSL
tara:strand:- start:40 stop:501 length:462 start_codon:yes stop_codon:yes gene_type:complete